MGKEGGKRTESGKKVQVRNRKEMGEEVVGVCGRDGEDSDAEEERTSLAQ